MHRDGCRREGATAVAPMVQADSTRNVKQAQRTTSKRLSFSRQSIMIIASIRKHAAVCHLERHPMQCQCLSLSLSLSPSLSLSLPLSLSLSLVFDGFTVGCFPSQSARVNMHLIHSKLKSAGELFEAIASELDAQSCTVTGPSPQTSK